MRKKFFLNLVKYFSVLTLVFFGSLFCQKNADAKIETNTRATAETGGNTIEGNGTIKTGDAKATVKATNIVNGETNVQNKTEAKAEVQSDGATASVEVNGEKKACTAENGEGCEVEISDTDNSASATVDDTTDVAEKVETEKNIVENIASAITNFTKSFADKIISWFS